MTEPTEVKPKKRNNRNQVARSKGTKDDLSQLLTEQQELFAQHVALTNNAAEAYRQVFASEGANDGTVWKNTYRAVRHPRIAARVEELRGVMRKIAMNNFEVTAERIIGEMAACAFANASDYLEWNGTEVTIKPSSQLTEMQRKAVISVVQTKGQSRSIKLELADKLKALEKLGKNLGLFSENVKVSHEHAWIENADKQLAERFRALIDRRRTAAIDVQPESAGGDPTSVHVGILGQTRSTGTEG
jgi:phage terminase small subunit